MRADPVTRSLKGWPSGKCPAILELEDERAAVLLEVRDRDGLIYAPGLAEPIWVKLAEIEPAYTGRAVVDTQNRRLVLQDLQGRGGEAAPAEVATNNVRYYEFAGDELKLTTKDGSGRPTATITWKKSQ